MKQIGVINGPNLDKLGERKKDIYGNGTLVELEGKILERAKVVEVEVECYQTNLEGGIIEKIREWERRGFGGCIINAGGYTHTSVAIRDAIEASSMVFIEVHISNLLSREEFRHRSLIGGVCRGSIMGLGAEGYLLGLDYLGAFK